MKNLDCLKVMIESEFFTIEMLIQYLVKHQDSPEVIKILIDRLNFYSRQELLKYMTEFIFWSLSTNNENLINYFLNVSAEHFNFFFLISNCIEIWGHQFAQQNNYRKSQIRSILEDCENKIVNGDKTDMVPKTNNPADRPEPLDSDELHRIVIGKKTKNDFKDEIRNFVLFLVRLSYMLLNNLANNPRQIGIDCLHKMNLELYKRRMSASETMFGQKGTVQVHVQRHHDALQGQPQQFIGHLTRSCGSCTTSSGCS
jgi:hypothetical protein